MVTSLKAILEVKKTFWCSGLKNFDFIDYQKMKYESCNFSYHSCDANVRSLIRISKISRRSKTSRDSSFQKFNKAITL
jgi:hypothetical protein